ncbi:MAG: type II toxin-antitoxin system VapC family toxin [Cyanobacteria bacterium P01_E01_bin.42]
MIVFLDTNILGKLANPNKLQEALECRAWFERLYGRGTYFVSSELCFYEVKRSLILAVQTGKTSAGIKQLEDIEDFIEFFEVDRPVAELAAELWARGRLRGQPTADENNLDIDTIIMAHWQLLSESFPGRKVTIATTNVRHLSLFAEAKEWQDITY